MTREEDRLRGLVKRALVGGQSTREFEEHVLSAVRRESSGASGLPVRRARPAPSRRRKGWPLWLSRPPVQRAVAVAAVAAIALGILGAQRAGLLGAQRPATARVSGTPSAKALGASMLAAFQAPGGQVAVVRQSIVTSGRTQMEEWTLFPSLPRPGDQVQRHDVVTEGGTVVRETWAAYTQPPVGHAATGELVTVHYPNRTWSDQPDGPIPGLEFALSVTVFEPDYLQREIATGLWTVDGARQQGGRRVIELSRTQHTPEAAKNSMWVDAATYLPVRFVHDEPSTHQQLETDYEFLPATSADLTPLTPSIPAGFSRTSPPPIRP